MIVTSVAAEVSNLEYVQRQAEDAEMAMDAMRIDLKNGEHIYVPNGSWSKDNPALAVQAFLGVRPSTMDQVEGALLPYKIGADGELGVPMYVINQGQQILEREPWFEVEDDGDDGYIDLDG